MKFLNNLYQHINILSFDVVAGAVVGALFFGTILSVSVSLVVIAALALTVWIVYTLDHLRDAMTIPMIASTDRHRFHQQNFRTITAVLVVIAAVDFVVIWFLPAAVVRWGIVLGVAVMLYLIFQRHLKFLKEFFVACLYIAGILLPSLAGLEVHLVPEETLIIAKYFITALMNLLLFSLFDFQEDRHQRQHSFVTWFGPVSTRYGIILLGILNILSGFWLWTYDPGVALVFICMNLILLSMLYFGRRLIVNNYYRVIGDGVFFIPVLYML